MAALTSSSLSLSSQRAAAASLSSVCNAALRNTNNGFGRRGFLSLLISSAAAAPQVGDSKKALLQEYLKRSKENKEKNDKERLEGYYKRNYKDYFEFIEGSLKEKSSDLLSESEKGILEWLENNRKRK